MRLRVLIICLPLVVGCLLGCKEDKPAIPPHRMEAILYDVQMAEVYSTMAGKDSAKDFAQKNDDSLAMYYASIFRHYSITATEFKTAVEWYRAHPAALDSIYSRILPKVDAGMR